MVTVHEWVDRAVHGGIVFTLGPGCLPRRMRGRQTRWREADSLAAARPPLAPPPNWTSSAAGCPDRCLQTLRLTCGTQAERVELREPSCSKVAAGKPSPVTVGWCQHSRFGLFLCVLLAHLPLFDCATVWFPTGFFCQALIEQYNK